MCVQFNQVFTVVSQQASQQASDLVTNGGCTVVPLKRTPLSDNLIKIDVSYTDKPYQH